MTDLSTWVFYLVLILGRPDYGAPAIITLPGQYPDLELCMASGLDAKMNATAHSESIQFTCVPAPQERG